MTLRGCCVLLALCACAKESQPGVAPPPAKPPATPSAATARAPEVDRSRSLVTVLCGDGEPGPGYFSAPDRVVTRARFVCDAPRVRLHDGRTLLGTVRAKQKELDIAELQIAGGEGEPLEPGSAMALAETDDVSVPGVGPGTVRSVTRTRLGAPQLEVAFERVPPPGSVVVDARGRAVGLTLDATWVLPVDALGPAATWSELQQRSKPGLAQELAALRRALQKPGLATALVDKTGALNAVLLSYQQEPVVMLGGCNTAVRPSWEPFRANAWLDSPSRELFHFLDANDLDIGLYVSTVAVPRGSCGGAELFVEGADPLLHRAPVGKTDQAMAVTQRAPAAPPPPAPRAPTPQLDAADERMWRGRFAALREEQEHFDREVRDKQRFIAEADRAVLRNSRRAGAMFVLTPDERVRYDQYKRDLEEAPAQRATFQRKLDDLEREASNASVPREWRR